MIEKILSEIQKLILQNEEGANACYPSAMARESAYYECKEIVQEVAKEYAEIARESREDFMEIVYSELEEDEDNNRANRIIDAFDTYAPYQKGE